MDIEARDRLVSLIDETMESPLSMGLPIRQLRKDLAKSNKPLVISYADLAALEHCLNEMIDESCEQQQNHDSYLNRKVTIARADDAKLSQIYEKANEMANQVSMAFSDALDKGVLTTQDKSRGRIAGA